MPIIDVGGRFRSIRTDKETISALQSEVVSLTPEERRIAEMILQDVLSGEDSYLHTEITSNLYRIKPVSMEKFLTDPYFLGDTGKSLYPKLKESLIEMFAGTYKISFYGGGLGVGKSTAGCIAILRMIYEISCLKDPQSAYGISKADTISFPCISVTEEVAERNLLDKLRQYISESPYFTQEFSPVKNTSGKGIMFPNRILIPPGASTEAAVLGTNSMGCLIDEGNFFGRRRYSAQDNNTNKSNIEIIYEGMKRRIETRFLSRGKLPGLIFVASSKRSVDSFTEREIRKNIDRDDVYVCEYSNWEVHPEGRYGKDRFRVAVGSETTQSRILKKEEQDPDGVLTIEVPMEFYESFEQDLDQAIRDIAGISTVSVTPFIGRREKIYEAIDGNRVHAFNQEVWDMSFPGRIDWTKLAKQMPDGSWRPIVNPEAPRHIHLDLSKTGDRTGFSVSHVAGYTPVQKLGMSDSEMAPVIHIDFMLALQAPRAGEIIYAEIRKLIYEFSKHGFFIKLVSADQFQCFTGDTKISLLSGEEISFKDLAERYKDKPTETIWVYSFDGRRIVPGKAFFPRKTGKKRVLSVHLDNGEVVRCTHDHQWMLRDGTWKQAKDLIAGESLMPLYRRTTDSESRWAMKGYEEIYQPLSSSPYKWELTHRIVARSQWGAIRGKVVHHNGPCLNEQCRCGRAVFCKRNNDPGSLMLMDHDKHVGLHSGLAQLASETKRYRFKHDQAYRKRVVESGKRLAAIGLHHKREAKAASAIALFERGYKTPNSPQASKRKADIIRARNKARTFEQHPRALNLSKEWFFKIAEKHNSLTEISIATGISRATLSSYLKKLWGDAETGRNAVFKKNHKVVKIEDLGQEEDVYDISVHEYENFALSAGVFVHNSASTLQSLSSQGYKTKVVSVEPAGGPYESLKLAIYENRLRIYNYPPLIKELRELQKNWKTGKVDHPETGAKDISDTIAANIFTLSQQAYGVTDTILTSDQLLRDVEDITTWVLDDPNTIVIEQPKEDQSKPEWRKNAEHAINEEKAQQQNWRSNFALPFEMG